ncbi:MAG TPA: RES family NAD+ phosphorylase [Thermoanaerobaculia bacterium]|nr:RES family NAD+ phosphorylase [Thermoanaerobaculia bacterium]
MTVAWRITEARYSRLDGEGARQYGSRWTSPGFAVVYAADSRALAALETLVNMRYSDAFPKYIAIRCEFPDDLVWNIESRHVPPDWRDMPAPDELRAEIGDPWLQRLRTPVMAVPSAVIPQERNYILNPAHPDFSGIAIGEPEPFVFDIRLLNRYNPAP